MEEIKRTAADGYSPLTLAFIGDGVYDLLVRDYLSEREQAVYKRGRNAAPKSASKHGTLADYHSATGLEALFGYLHINGEQERINELFSLIIENQDCQ